MAFDFKAMLAAKKGKKGKPPMKASPKNKGKAAPKKNKKGK